MKPFLYSILFLLTINFSFAQTKEIILKKSFKVNPNTTLNIDIDNVSVLFEESFDNKIHFDYSIIFGRYSKRKREDILDQVKTTISNKKNMVTLDVKNSMFMGEIYKLDVTQESLLVSMKDFLKNERNKQYKYKSKDSLLKKINFSEGSYFKDFVKKNEGKYKNKTPFKNKKVFIQKFIIKVPKNIVIRIKALHSNITINYDLDKPIIANTFKGHLKFKKLLSNKNKFNLTNGIFQTEEIVGGVYNFKDISKIVIGSVSNAILDSETSKIEVGEIGENVFFNDFNSKIYLYNFSNNFNQFKYKGEYSELSFYKVIDNNFAMSVYGHNTALNMNKTKATFGISKEKKLEKILEKKVKKGIDSNGNIEIELTNGILNIK